MNLKGDTALLGQVIRNPDFLQTLLLDANDVPGYSNFVTQISSESNLEAGSNPSGDLPSSSRGDSGEQGCELDESTRRLGSLEKQSKLSTTANSKNRAAQKRYRERQKGKMETYKQQVEDLGKQLSQLQTENESLEKRNQLLEKVVQMKDQKPVASAADTEQVFEETGNNIWQNAGTYAAVAAYVNTIRKNRPPLVSAQQAKSISPEDLRQVKSDYVKELATLLLAADEGRNTIALSKLEEYVLQARLASISLLRSMSVRSFAQVLALKKRLALSGQISERIMLAIKLTPDQRRDYIRARRALIARNGDIRDKRRRIVADLELAVPSVAPLMCGQTVAMLRACESSDQFKESLEEEHRSMAQFHSDCVQVLTPIQEARALLEAHPGNPDPWLISGYLEAEQDGCLAEWLQAHSGVQKASSGFASADSRNTLYPDADPKPAAGDRCTASQIVSSPSGQGAVLMPETEFVGGAELPMNMPKLEPVPLQTTQQGLQDLLSSPSLDLFGSGLDNFGPDDMWVDFFPGLLTQTQS